MTGVQTCALPIYRRRVTHSLDKRVVDAIASGAEPTAVELLVEQTFVETESKTRQHLKSSCYRLQTMCRTVESGRRQLVEHFIAAGYPVDVEPGDGNTSPLNVAVHYDREDLVRLLLRHGASVSTESRYSIRNSKEVFVCALELSVVLDRPNLMSILKRVDDQRKTPPQKHRTALHFTCLHGAYHCLEPLLADPKVIAEDLNAMEKRVDERQLDDGKFNLSWCSFSGVYVRLLLGVRYVIRRLESFLDDRLPASLDSLHTVQRQHRRMVDNIFAHVDDCYTPLMLGVRHGSRLVRKLLDSGASATAVSSARGYTALHCAASSSPKVITYDDKPWVSKDLPVVLRLLLEAGCEDRKSVV